MCVCVCIARQRACGSVGSGNIIPAYALSGFLVGFKGSARVSGSLTVPVAIVGVRWHCEEVH